MGMTTTGLAIVSGGLDSTTLLYDLIADGLDVGTVVSFDYGQRHARRELACAGYHADHLGLDHVTIDLASTLGPHLTGSALTDPTVDVPHGHYADESMRATVVPNRNLVMLSIAGSIAVARGFGFVATGVHAGDHPIYPDCRPEFITAASLALMLGTAGYAPDGFHIRAPFVHWSKADIVARADDLNVEVAETWSCYEGGRLHCGRCGTCVERREAFADAGVDDPTEYRFEPVVAG